MQRIPNLYIASSPLHGRGVFTAQDLVADDLIEICPVLVLPARDREAIDQTKLFHYCFLWGEEDMLYGLALGYGSLYNHATEANLRFEADYQRNTLSLFARQAIPAGTELTINYLGKVGARQELWFTSKEPASVV